MAARAKARQVGRIHMPADLDDRLQRILRRLGRDHTLAWLVRQAFLRAIDDPADLRLVAGPYDRQLSNVACTLDLIRQAGDVGREVFGDRRGSYSDFVRAALDKIARDFESIEIPRGDQSQLSESFLPEFWAPADIAGEILARRSGPAGESVSRFVRLSVVYALAHPEQLPAPPAGERNVLIRAATASAKIVRKVRIVGKRDLQTFMLIAVALRVSKLSDGNNARA